MTYRPLLRSDPRRAGGGGTNLSKALTDNLSGGDNILVRVDAVSLTKKKGKKKTQKKKRRKLNDNSLSNS